MLRPAFPHLCATSQQPSKSQNSIPRGFRKSDIDPPQRRNEQRRNTGEGNFEEITRGENENLLTVLRPLNKVAGICRFQVTLNSSPCS
jgi:hypothetical protein